MQLQSPPEQRTEGRARAGQVRAEHAGVEHAGREGSANDRQRGHVLSGDIRAIVSDQGNFESLVIGTGPGFTVVAFLELPPGSWVVFATVALAAASGVTGTSVVQTGFLLDGEIYSTFVQSDFVVADTLDGGVSGFRVVPLTTGLALDRPRTIQVGCTATEPETVSSQPTTITAI